MIRYLKRSEINNEKYNSCIENSYNSRIYAFSWYLDCVADNWDALVLNDYEAVMPLPWKQKYLIKYIYPPAWTQQLGVFSTNKVSEELVLSFIKAIPKKFKKVTIQFNAENKFQLDKNIIVRKNFILKLDKSYEELYQGFNINRKRTLKKSKKQSTFLDEELSSSEFLKFYANSCNKFQLNELTQSKLKKILDLKQVKLIGVKNNGKLECALLYIFDGKRITYLLPVATEKAKVYGLPTLIINHLLMKYQNSNLVFDFEGSMINGVSFFYRSFGAKLENYFLFKKYSLFPLKNN